MLLVMSGLGFTFLASSSLDHSLCLTLFLVSSAGKFQTLQILYYCTLLIEVLHVPKLSALIAPYKHEDFLRIEGI